MLKKGKTYVLGKKLDLTFLDDIVVQLDGQILVGYFFVLVFKFEEKDGFLQLAGTMETCEVLGGAGFWEYMSYD